jgi:hypothetical protein
MLDHTNNSIATDFGRHREAGRKREPDIAVLLIVALFAGGAIVCTVLIVPVVLAAATEMIRPAGMTYQQCGAVKQDRDRLACCDSVLRQLSIRSGKGVYPMTSGEIRAEQPDLQ